MAVRTETTKMTRGGIVSITRIGINGFGRIGRQVFKILWEQYPGLRVSAIGVAAPAKTEVRALLLQHDSTYGAFPHQVEAHVRGDASFLTVDGQVVPIIPRVEPHRTATWADYDVDIVIDATGRCKRGPYAEEHLSEGVRKVIVSSPSRWADVTVLYGVNEQAYDPWNHDVISAGSCTTNSLAPVTMVLDEAFGLAEGFVTTVHAYTNSQSLLDSTHKDPRRARAAGCNIIPTTTGAARALDQVLPGLGRRIDAAALRVPVPSVSMIDLTARLKKPVSIDAVNDAFRRAADGPLHGILDVSDAPLVSNDYVRNPHSAIVDALSTSVVGQLVRVAAWYDNEWGYSCRVADLTAYVSRQLSSTRETATWALPEVGPQLTYASNGPLRSSILSRRQS